MNIYCINRFKNEYEKLISLKKYRTLEQSLIDYFFNKNICDLMSGVRLNNSNLTPFIKKRIEGSGGYRLYYLLLIKEDNLYLMFLHPKTGRYGASNIDTKSIRIIYKEVLECIKTDDIYELSLDSEGIEIIFIKQSI